MVKATKMNQRVVLNIGGEIYETRLKTLERFPQSLLGNREKRANYYCETTRQYFFHRSKLFFDAILFFYQSSGILQCPYDIPIELFEEECRFFEIPEEAINKLSQKTMSMLEVDEQRADSPVVEKLTLKARLWNVFQNPETSIAAKYFAIFSMAMISLSVAASCLETLPSLKVHSNSLENNIWAIIELALNSWFLLELTIGIILTPCKRSFFTSLMTWVDIVAVIPYFIVLIISTDAVSSVSFLRIVRLVRVVRLFRLSRHSRRIKLVIDVIKSSLEELKTLLMCFLMVVVLGGSLMYFMEGYADGSHFTDIPSGIYWSIQTITTLGYGDIYPQTIPGRIFAILFMIGGAMTLCISVLGIIDKFSCIYEDRDTAGD